MVAPITGPFVKTETWDKWNGNFTAKYVYRRRYTSTYKQKKPWDRPLDYYMEDKSTFNYVDLRGGNYGKTYDFALGWLQSLYDQTYPAAYAKFVEAVNEQSMWAVNIREGGKTIAQLASRAGTLLKVARAINRFDFLTATRELRLAVTPKGVSRKKSFANNWLEYHFGWEPLVKDIGAAVETLANPFTPKDVKVRKTGFYRNVVVGDKSATSYNVLTDEYKLGISIGATVRVKNSDLFLLSQTGFINPLAVAWELVPFSFVVDWFANVGQCLSSMTDFVGLQVDNGYVSRRLVAQRQEQWFYGAAHNVPSQRGVLFINGAYNTVILSRILGISGPSLKLKPLKRVSTTRGATAIALLTQFLKDRK